MRSARSAWSAVVIGQRISAHAGPGDVFVSRTVADLITGSDIELQLDGDFELKGLSGTWPIYRVIQT
jgi:class 3 adenylate cyclase